MSSLKPPFLFSFVSGTEISFWVTTAGRVVSIIIMIIVFGVFSFIFKSFRGGSSRGDSLCTALFWCRRKVSRLTSCCKLQTRISRSTPPDSARSRSNTSRSAEGEEENGDGIVTISHAGGPTTAGPNLSVYFSPAEAGPQDTHAPPPDYTSALSMPSPAPREEQGEAERESPRPPDYSSVTAPPVPDVESSSDPPPPPPPPDDQGAPPSYELPTPPSYDSLFNSSRAWVFFDELWVDKEQLLVHLIKMWMVWSLLYIHLARYLFTWLALCLSVVLDLPWKQRD